MKINSFGEGSDTTEYHPYDSQLPQVFEDIKSLINNTIPSVPVEHIGSSSIPGVGGRNVLDIAIPALTQKHEAIRSKLKEMGFEDSPFPHYLPLLVASTTFEEKEYFILLYVVSSDNETYKNWISFRNHMRTHPDDAKEYDNTKKQVINEGYTRGDLYQNAKAPFIQKISAKIKNG